MFTTIPFLKIYRRSNSTTPAETHPNKGAPGGLPGWLRFPALGRSPAGGRCNSLRDSCRDRGAWRATYSPWGHQELEMAEAATHTHTHTHTHTQIISGRKCLKSMWEEKILTIYGRGKMLACTAQHKKWYHFEQQPLQAKAKYMVAESNTPTKIRAQTQILFPVNTCLCI